MTPPRLTTLSDVTGRAALPGYDPQAFGTGIVHIGPGAFHRAHQAAMTDAALAAEGGDWRITGVSLRSTVVAEALNPQNGLYTLIERGAGEARGRVVGAIGHVIAGNPASTLKALAAPRTRLVTLTVTEKGYGIDRATRAPDMALAVNRADLERPQTPSGVLGHLAAALAARRAAGIAPFTVLSCDNLPGNGALLRDGLTAFARDLDPGLAGWIAENVAFPSSMVDRITPAPTEATRLEAERLTGCLDLAAVETEAFTQWVIEDDFRTGRPAWEAGGALFVKDVAPFEEMKLTMLNGSHTLIAALGVVAGLRLVRDAMAEPLVRALVARHLAAAGALLPALPGMDRGDYARALLSRFANPAIAHETRQIAMDASQKLPQRIFRPAMAALGRGRDVTPFAFATAAWMRYTLGRDDEGRAFPLNDPREDEIRAAMAGAPGADAAVLSGALHGLPGLIPTELAAASIWRDAIERALARMLQGSVLVAVREELAR